MGFCARRLHPEGSDISNTNKALAVLHNSVLFTTTPPRPSSFNCCDAAQEGSLNMLYHRFIFLTSNTMSKCIVRKHWCFSWAITFYTSPLIHSKRKHIKHFSKVALKNTDVLPEHLLEAFCVFMPESCTASSDLSFSSSVTSDLTHPVCSWARCQHRRRPTLSASSKKGKQH